VSYWLLAVTTVFVLYALFSQRLSRTIVTGPMVFVTAGLIVGSDGLGAIDVEPKSEAVTLLLEVTLAIVLFSDATTVNSSSWRNEAYVPGRLLLIALPLTIAVGLGSAVLLFTELGIWEAALIGAILAPTDASLGQAVISNPRVPQRIRQGLNVESGLNDGIALPLVLVFLAAAEESATGGSIGQVLGFIGQEVLIAAVVGIGFGWLGGKALIESARRGWISKMWTQVALDGSGFIAAWLTGLVLGAVTRKELDDDVSEFSETLGSVLTLVSFLVFGAVLLGPALGNLTWQIAVYAVLSLAVVRMVSVAGAMFGSRLSRPSVLYLGWFGPRGLASIIFAGIVIEDAVLPGSDTIIDVVMITVALSVYAHGATSWYGSERYADWYLREESADPDIPEAAGAPTTPARHLLDPPDR
jgi:NhaP-type Na+/H+ or K+/H+ antiporter